MFAKTLHPAEVELKSSQAHFSHTFRMGSLRLPNEDNRLTGGWEGVLAKVTDLKMLLCNFLSTNACVVSHEKEKVGLHRSPPRPTPEESAWNA